jgi:hypothetical protein
MVTALDEISSFMPDYIYQAVLLRDPTGPYTETKKFQRLWFANTLKRASHHCFYQFKDSKRSPAVRFDPVT